MGLVRTHRPFPFCITDGGTLVRGGGTFVSADLLSGSWEYAEGSEVSAPASATQQEMFEWFWRVRKWRLVYDLALAGTYDNGLGYTAELAIAGVEGEMELDWTDVFARAEEKDLCCWSGDLEGAFSTFRGAVTHEDGATLTEGTDPPTSAHVHLSGFLRMFQGVGDAATEPASRNGADYYPRWDAAFICRVITPDQPANGMVALNSNTLANVVYPDTSWAFNGGTVPAQIATFAATSTISVSLEPLQWWPYDPDDGGGPFWGASTGDRLR